MGGEGKRSNRWEVLHRPALIPNHASSDFNSFLRLKKRLAGQKLHEDEEARNEVTTRLRAQALEFCDFGVQNISYPG